MGTFVASFLTVFSLCHRSWKNCLRTRCMGYGLFDKTENRYWKFNNWQKRNLKQKRNRKSSKSQKNSFMGYRLLEKNLFISEIATSSWAKMGLSLYDGRIKSSNAFDKLHGYFKVDKYRGTSKRNISKIESTMSCYNQRV